MVVQVVGRVGTLVAVLTVAVKAVQMVLGRYQHAEGLAPAGHCSPFGLQDAYEIHPDERKHSDE